MLRLAGARLEEVVGGAGTGQERTSRRLWATWAFAAAWVNALAAASSFTASASRCETCLVELSQRAEPTRAEPPVWVGRERNTACATRSVRASQAAAKQAGGRN